MRISRIHSVMLLAGLFAVAGLPATASAQELIVQRTQMGPADRDSTQTAMMEAVDRDMNALFDAQRAYYRQHRRFAPSYAQLPEFPLGPSSGIRMTAGDDWYVVLGGSPQMGVSQQVVYFKKAEDTQVAQAGHAAESTAVQTERVEGTMTRPR